jgi:hypothetical protein
MSLKAIEYKIIQDQIEFHYSRLNNNMQKNRKKLLNLTLKFIFHFIFLIFNLKSSDKFVRPFKLDRLCPKF